jgi:diguanylate cyclase
MNTPLARQPYEIARETVKLLTARKLVPSPENYRAVYHEVAGTKPLEPFPVDELRSIAAALPAINPGQQRQKGILEFAIGQGNWDKVQTALVGYASFAVAPSAASASASSGEARVSGIATLADDRPSYPPLTPEFLEQIARVIEFALPALGDEDKRFHDQAVGLVAKLRDKQADPVQVKTALTNFAHRMSFAAEDQAAIKSTLLDLLRQVIDNIGELVMDDAWVKGQVDALKVAATPPLSLRRLDDVQRRLKDVIFKQSESKSRMLAMQEQTQQMLAAFIERLSAMAASSGEFQTKIEGVAKRISGARSIEEVGSVLQEAIDATRAIASDTKASREDLQAMQDRVRHAEAEIAKLHRELDKASSQARHDPLTGALNRKGMDEALEREVKSMQRKQQLLCVALLDIDNFKKLNDTMGHDTGDKALVHLAEVTRNTIRPQDTLARYGGEEFLIVMPDTSVDEAVLAMQRLQRELTTRYFLRESEKVLITFSAGVAQVADNETAPEAIKRADQAMYLAKRAGKNRVVAA